jgi:predicted KAP-like P-loop ATPase
MIKSKKINPRKYIKKYVKIIIENQLGDKSEIQDLDNEGKQVLSKIIQLYGKTNNQSFDSYFNKKLDSFLEDLINVRDQYSVRDLLMLDYPSSK